MPANAPEKSESGLKTFHAVLRGSVGFAVVSIAAFGVWAFGGRQLHAYLGTAGLYGACAIVFIGLSGLALSPLVEGPRSLVQFYKIFVPAFVAYAVAWCAAWFALGFGWGEWLASILGSLACVAVIGLGFRNFHPFFKVALAMIVLHSAGYFAGGQLMGWLMGPGGAGLLSGLSKAQISTVAKLGWGLCYGLGFGAGLGYAFSTFQQGNKSAISSQLDQIK